MAELTIRLIIDPTTGKKNVVIGYHSDSDALPMEHEDEHRRLVNALIEGGALTAAELGAIVIERGEEEGTAEAATEAAAEQAVSRKSISEDG